MKIEKGQKWVHKSSVEDGFIVIDVQGTWWWPKWFDGRLVTKSERLTVEKLKALGYQLDESSNINNILNNYDL